MLRFCIYSVCVIFNYGFIFLCYFLYFLFMKLENILLYVTRKYSLCRLKIKSLVIQKNLEFQMQKKI